MAGRVVFFLHSASYEPAFQAASLGITAAAMGDEVYFVFAFEALRQLARSGYGLPRTERADGLNVPTAAKMLGEARAMGAKFVACDTTAKICGFSPGELLETLDEVMGLASLWRLTEGARVLTF